MDLVLFRRTFRPLAELKDLERYAAELDRVARHANAGTLGCFVDARAHEGVVEVALYDRWFDGEHLRCHELAHRRYDAGDEQALVASAEFVAELEDRGPGRLARRMPRQCPCACPLPPISAADPYSARQAIGYVLECLTAER